MSVEIETIFLQRRLKFVWQERPVVFPTCAENYRVGIHVHTITELNTIRSKLFNRALLSSNSVFVKKRVGSRRGDKVSSE